MSRYSLREYSTGSIAKVLSSSRLFRDYEAAFTKASGLPLILRGIRSRKDVLPSLGNNSFCMLMAGSKATCAACLELQSRLEKESTSKPCTLTCFAGLCETAVPVRIGNQTVAFLETGHVFLQKPAHNRFKKLAQTVLKQGGAIDLKRAKDAWAATKVFSTLQYEGFVQMLAVFARHLEECGNGLVIEASQAPEAAVLEATKFILAHSSDDLRLAKVARVVNLSAHSFSKKFRAGTGVAFSQYVARVRVEKAKHLLQTSLLRISEIAYKSGFKSVSQFNRQFHRILGRSPTDFLKSPLSKG